MVEFRQYQRSLKIVRKTKRILILSHSSEIGGAELSMLDFFDFWTAQDKTVEPLFIIKYPVDRLGAELEKRKWKYKVVDYSGWSGRKRSYLPENIFRGARRNSKAILEIEAIIQDYKPDVVMTNTVVAPWAAFAAKLSGLPHVWFVREYGDVDHGHTFENSREESFEDIGILSELVVTNSTSLGKHTAQYVPEEKITTLYTPFKVEKIAELSKRKADSPFSKNARLKIAMVGVLRPSKGQEKAIEAVSLLKDKGIDVELCLMGRASDPEYEDVLKDMIKDKGVAKNVHLIGYQTNPYTFIRHADVCIMASKMEAFGRTTFEYLCLGKPVIGAAAGGTLEMVKDGKNGFLFDENNVQQIADKLEAYVKDPDLLSKHQTAAKNSAVHMIHGEYGAAVLIKKLDKIIDSKGPHYKLPNYTRQWLGIPKIAEHLRPRSHILHKLRIAKRIGPKQTYYEARKRLETKVKRANKR